MLAFVCTGIVPPLTSTIYQGYASPTVGFFAGYTVLPANMSPWLVSQTSYEGFVMSTNLDMYCITVASPPPIS